MPSFTLFLIKDKYEIIPRLINDNGSIKDNFFSVFNIKIMLEYNYEIEKEIEKRKFEPVMIEKANSPEITFLKRNEVRDPWWKSFWKISDELNLQNASAVVFKKIDDRLFAFTHGFGRYFLNPFCLEYDFGLRVAVNMIDDSQIRTAGLFTPSEIGLRTTKHSGKCAKFHEYEINIYNSMLKSVAGNVRKEYKDYFKTIHGADSINFNYSGNYPGIFPITKMFFDVSSQKKYLDTNFYWIDNFKPVRDEQFSSNLDSILLKELNDRNEEILLMYPDIFDSKRDIYFEYSGIPEKVVRVDQIYAYLDMNEQYY
jgi:uncharacterized protein (TIGR04141 family)